MSRARLLLADDNALLSAQIRSLLEPDFDVVGVVGSGEELESAADILSPEVVVTDIGMPGEDGLSLIQRVRALENGGTAIRAIALTAYAREEDGRRALDAGYHLHAAKPVEAEELVRLVARLASHVPTGPETVSDVRG